MKVVICLTLLKYLLPNVLALNVPSSSVFVVTPSSRSHGDEGRSAPFYYHNWRRRMDPPSISTTTAATTTTKVKTPDLIFAEFESDGGDNMKKSIRNLLEKERVRQKASAAITSPSTISQPIYVPDEDIIDVNHAVTINKEEDSNSASDTIDNSAMYNKFPELNYLPLTTTTASSLQLDNVENIWHIIDNEKQDQYSGKWEEVPVESNKEEMNSNESNSRQNGNNKEKTKTQEDVIDDNFAFPGFASNPGNGAENESRAIRTEPNLRFPYVSLKPFQMKNMKQPVSNGFPNSKKSNNMFNMDNFKDIQNPVRGEVQEVNPIRQQIDRYNPAQPYLPHEYGSKSKQSSPPTKAVANLVPPPPPPPPKITGNDFPVPTSYESFPPFAGPDTAPGPSLPADNPPVSMYQQPNFPSYTPQNDDSDDGSMDSSYQYQAPKSSFRPTLPPLSKPFGGYSYNKPPSSNDDGPPATNVGYSYQKPPMTMDSPPSMDMGGQEDSPPMADDKPDFHGYHYIKPPPEDDHSPPVFKPHGSFQHEGDYPELIFEKPHGGPGPMKGVDNMNDDGAGMMPPPPPADIKPDMDSGPPMDDHGFPPGFPGDFKFHHDFDDHDLYHHHHHHTTTTTTTTTESPRVNRYSYYYLGKKLYYLPLYFSVYFIIYVGALIIKAVLRHKIVYPNSWRPNDTTASFLSKRSLDSWDLSHENLHEVTGRVTKAIGEAAEKYVREKNK